MDRLFIFVMVFFVIYSLLPTILLWFFQIGAFKRGSSATPFIALTFDNFPDPNLTLPLLRMLKEKGIKATFFIAGTKAEKYPQLLHQIVEEGHELGVHNYSPYNNWLLTPKRNWQQIERTSSILKKAVGLDPLFYRPPLGHVTLYNLLRTRKRKTIALWSVSYQQKNSTKVARILSKVRNGSVISTNTHGFPQAQGELPELLQAFSSFLQELQRRGFQFLTIGELSRERLQTNQIKQELRSFTNRFLFSLWKRWESLVHRILQLEPVYTDQPSLFRLRLRRYHGKPILMDNGEWLQRGDEIGELHINNELFIHALETSRSAVQLATSMVRMGERSLPILSQFVEEHEKYRNIKAVYGITMIYRGANPLGFKVEELPRGLFVWATTIYLRMYLSVMHPRGRHRLKQRRDLLIPKRVLMSREILHQRFTHLTDAKKSVENVVDGPVAEGILQQVESIQVAKG